jgi:hypothetical protein
MQFSVLPSLPHPSPLGPVRFSTNFLSIRHRNKVNLILSTTQIKAKKTKKKVLLYLHRLCPVMERLFERERETEWAKEAF